MRDLLAVEEDGFERGRELVLNFLGLKKNNKCKNIKLKR